MSRGTVLLVEDNPRNLKLARDLLEYAGFTVHVAGSGEEAIEQAERVLPDLVLMDLQLPGIDGHTALSELRARPRTAGIRVVALTAFAMAADRARALDEGFDGYLEKPISVREFASQVQSQIDAGQHREGAQP
jgi:two-component system cell cycle response regulator DivK